jgi:hypothetical protein
MLYQVLTRVSAGAAWMAYATPTSDPYDVIVLIQAANQHYAEVTILQAEDAGALATLLSHIRRGGELPPEAASPVPGLTATPRVLVEDPPMEARRWEMERGPGGDHDQPYSFALPRSMGVVAAWLHLLGRRWRERAVTSETTDLATSETTDLTTNAIASEVGVGAGARPRLTR